MTYAGMYPTLPKLVESISETEVRELVIKAYYAGLSDGIHAFAVNRNGGLEVGVMAMAWSIVKKELLDECQDALQTYAR